MLLGSEVLVNDIYGYPRRGLYYNTDYIDVIGAEVGTADGFAHATKIGYYDMTGTVSNTKAIGWYDISNSKFRVLNVDPDDDLEDNYSFVLNGNSTQVLINSTESSYRLKSVLDLNKILSCNVLYRDHSDNPYYERQGLEIIRRERSYYDTTFSSSEHYRPYKAFVVFDMEVESLTEQMVECLLYRTAIRLDQETIRDDENQEGLKAQFKQAYDTLKKTIVSESGTNNLLIQNGGCLLYTSPSPRDRTRSRMPSSA